MKQKQIVGKLLVIAKDGENCDEIANKYSKDVKVEPYCVLKKSDAEQKLKDIIEVYTEAFNKYEGVYDAVSSANGDVGLLNALKDDYRKRIEFYAKKFGQFKIILYFCTVIII